MTSEELSDPRKWLRYYADKLDNLICPAWVNPCLLLDKLGELEELVDDHDLSGAWFSAHARVDNVVCNGDNARDVAGESMMFYRFRSDEIMAKNRALSRDRIFWGQLSAALMPLTISLRWPAIIGGALLKLATSCWVEGTWGNSNPCVIMVTIFAGMSIIYEEWEELTRARPRYISIMDGLIMEDNEREMNDKENPYDNKVDKDRSQAFFLAYHQLMAYHCCLLFCLEVAALFWRFEVSHFVCLV
jgi:hypothetical protein